MSLTRAHVGSNADSASSMRVCGHILRGEQWSQTEAHD